MRVGNLWVRSLTVHGWKMCEWELHGGQPGATWTSNNPFKASRREKPQYFVDVVKYKRTKNNNLKFLIGLRWKILSSLLWESLDLLPGLPDPSNPIFTGTAGIPSVKTSCSSHKKSTLYDKPCAYDNHAAYVHLKKLTLWTPLVSLNVATCTDRCWMKGQSEEMHPPCYNYTRRCQHQKHRSRVHQDN